jgi:class 3 adenylate cyclase/CHASE2 domain-containing sensor protein
METVGIQHRNASQRLVIAASVVSLVIALILLKLPYINALENRIGDACFKLVHWYSGGGQAAPQLFFVAIDDKSVDPDYSALSSPWGKGGWQTRSLWTMQLEQMEKIFQPKVLAYDILFRPGTGKADYQADPAAKTLNDIEEKGNQDMLNEFCDYEDNRGTGAPTPKLLFAYDFPDSYVSNDRLLQGEAAQQDAWFAKLKRFRLPEGSVAPGSKVRVYRTVRLPMDDILKSPSYYLGGIDVLPDPDSIYRRIPMVYAYQPPGSAETSYVPSFSLEAFLLWLGIEPEDLKKLGEGVPSISVQPGGELKIQTDRDEWSFPVDQQLRMPLVPRFVFNKSSGKNAKGPELARDSFVDLLERGQAITKYSADPQSVPEQVKNDADQAGDAIRNKIVIVGDAITAGTDMGNLPLEPEVPQSLVHLHALNNILQKDHLREITFPLKAAICLALALAMTWLYTLAPSRFAGLGSFALILCYPLLAIALLVANNLQLPVIAPTVLAISCFGLNSYRIYLSIRRGREEMRRLFSSTTSPHVLRLIEENPAAFYTHRKARATILFSDVEGFTTLSEKLDPPYLASLMNRYLSPMTAIIVEKDGYLHQYMGDGIMAIWGALLPDNEHEYKACLAAWQQIEAARALQETLPDGKPYKFRVRIGVNTGSVSVGIMGSDQKTQYSVIGDEVNLAARLEPTNKDYGTQIIIGPQTYAAAQSRIMVRRLDKIIVKGKSEAVLIYELLGIAELNTPAPGPWLAAFEAGLEHLWRREWDEADPLFAQADRLRSGGDAPSQLQRARIAEYRLHPPPEKWQGEFVRLKKD